MFSFNIIFFYSIWYCMCWWFCFSFNLFKQILDSLALERGWLLIEMSYWHGLPQNMKSFNNFVLEPQLKFLNLWIISADILTEYLFVNKLYWMEKYPPSPFSLKVSFDLFVFKDWISLLVMNEVYNIYNTSKWKWASGLLDDLLSINAKRRLCKRSIRRIK